MMTGLIAALLRGTIITGALFTGVLAILRAHIKKLAKISETTRNSEWQAKSKAK